MPRRTNQQIERFCFEKYTAIRPPPPGKIRYTDKPDVIIDGPRRIGIEVASLYIARGTDSASEQVQRPRRADALSRALAAHLAADRPKFELHVGFNPKHPIIDAQKLAPVITDLAVKLVGRASGMVPREDFAHIPEIAHVYLNAKEYPDCRWQAQQVHSTTDLSVDSVREAVAKKDVLIPEYQSCDAFELLLVVDFMDPAQDQVLSWSTEVGPIETAFSRVTIFKPQTRELLDVPVRRAGP